jgi:hypothetical protein
MYGGNRGLRRTATMTAAAATAVLTAACGGHASPGNGPASTAGCRDG